MSVINRVYYEEVGAIYPVCIFIVDDTPWVPVWETIDAFHDMIRNYKEVIGDWKKNHKLCKIPPRILEYINALSFYEKHRFTHYYDEKNYLGFTHSYWMPVDEFIEFVEYCTSRKDWKKSFIARSFEKFKKHYFRDVKSKIAQEKLYFRTREWQQKISAMDSELDQSICNLHQKETVKLKEYCKRKREQLDNRTDRMRIEAVCLLMDEPDIIAEATRMVERNKIVGKKRTKLRHIAGVDLDLDLDAQSALILEKYTTI